MADVETRDNPFPGLRPFNPDEDHLFFGREGQSDELLSRMRQARFLAIVGSSGSGKSSLVKAGMLPSLFGGFMIKAGSSWRIAQSRPGADPIAELASALNDPEALGSADDEDPELQQSFIEMTLRRSDLGLVRVVKEARLAPDENLLVLVDQFEELFRFKRAALKAGSQDEAAAFVKLLLTAAQQEDVPIYVVITMRSDFLGNCAEFQGLPEAINDGQYLIPRLTREQRREAIVGPAAVAGARMTSRLQNHLLNDVGDNPDQLPILQHALMRTFDHWAARNDDDAEIDLEDYLEVGGMAGALSQHAEEAYAELSDDGCKIAEVLFKTLTEMEDNRGIRRPTPFGEICDIADADPEAVVQVIDVFRRPGRSFLIPPAGVELNPDSMVDISHESLMRVWDRLDVWSDKEAESARMYKLLAEVSARHEEGEASLWREVELDQGLRWRDESRPNAVWAEKYGGGFERASKFLADSKAADEAEKAEAERRRLMKQRLGRGFVVFLGFVICLVTYLALDASDQADKAVRAEEEAVTAKNEAVTAKNEAVTAKDEAVTAKDEAVTAKEEAVTAKEEAVTAKEEAVTAKEEAVTAKEEAVTAKDEAVTAKDQARKSEEDALREKAEADTLGYKALARQLASQASQRTGDLSALLARQAYLFHTKYGGSPQEPYIYAALRSGLRDSPDVDTVISVTARVRAIALDSTGSVLVSGSDDGSILVRLPGLQADTIRGTSNAAVNALALSPDGKSVAVGDTGPIVRSYGLSTDRTVDTLQVHRGPVNSVAYSRDGGMLASGSSDSSVIVWDVANRDTVDLRAHRGSVTSVSFNLTGDFLASSSRDSTVILWRVNRVMGTPAGSGKLLVKKDRVLTHKAPVLSVAFHPKADTLTLATGDETGGTTLWKVGSSSEPMELPKKGGTVLSLAFSPGGRRLASGCGDGIVRVWNMEQLDTPEPILLDGHTGWVWSVAFNRADTSLVTSSADKTVRIWITKSAVLSDSIGIRLADRGLTREEWDQFVGGEIPFPKPDTKPQVTK